MATLGWHRPKLGKAGRGVKFWAASAAWTPIGSRPQLRRSSENIEPPPRSSRRFLPGGDATL